jgi:hypothetical protein
MSEEPADTKLATQDQTLPAEHYRSLSYEAERSGNKELAERLGQYAAELAQTRGRPMDPNWVLAYDPDRPIPGRHVSPEYPAYEIAQKNLMERSELVSRREEDLFMPSLISDRGKSHEEIQKLLKEHGNDVELTKQRWLQFIENGNGAVAAEVGKELIHIGYKERANKELDSKENCLQIIKGMTLEEFYLYVEWHVQGYRQERERMAERIVDYERDFRRKANEYIALGIIKVPRDTILKRLDLFKAIPIDKLIALSQGIKGSYSGHLLNMHVSTGLSHEEERNTYFHERLHAISGKTVLFKPESHSFRSDNYMSYDIQRIGLSFDIELKRSDGRFNWLNEAVTERLTSSMSGTPPDIYEEELALLDALLANGENPLSEELFYDAYFEDYDSEHTEIISAWKALSRAITQAYEPRLLVEIDRIVREEGVEAAINYLENRSHKPPQHKARWQFRKTSRS